MKVQDVHVTDPEILKESGWKKAQDLLLAEHKSAQAQADAYRGGAKDQAQLKTGLGVSLPLLNAAALGFAAAKDRSDFVPVVGFGSAAALGVGGLLSSPARQAIYLQAQTATLCSMAAYDVFLINEEEYKAYLADDSTLKRDIDEVTRKRDDLTKTFAAYKATMDAAVTVAKAAEQKAAEPATTPPAGGAAASVALNAQAAGRDSADVAYGGGGNGQRPYNTKPSPPPGPAKAKSHKARRRKATAAVQPPPEASPGASSAALEIRENGVNGLVNSSTSIANDALTAAATTQASLQAARERVDEAGRSLGAHRMAIKAQVDQNVQTTEITLDQIKAAISASALASTQASPSPPKSDTNTGAATTGAAKAQGAPLSVQDELAARARAVSNAMTALDTALATLSRDKTLADAWLQRELQKEHDATQVGTCTVSAQVVLTATPDNPAEVASGKSLKIQIHAPTTGGAPTFTKVEDNLTETMTTGGGYDYTLTIAESGSPKPATKDQSVVISSGSQSVTVKFSVTDAAPKGSDTTGGLTTTADSAADPSWATNDWKDVLTYDHKTGVDWPTALKAYAKRHKIASALAASGDKPSDDVNKVEAEAVVIIAASKITDSYEKAWVSNASMKDLKTALNKKLSLSLDTSGTTLDSATRDAISKVDPNGGKILKASLLVPIGLPADPTAS